MGKVSDENIGASPDAGKAEASLFNALAVSDRENGSGVRFLSREAALEDADRTAFHANLAKSCKD
jgi:hypothetical protein